MNKDLKILLIILAGLLLVVVFMRALREKHGVPSEQKPQAPCSK